MVAAIANCTSKQDWQHYNIKDIAAWFYYLLYPKTTYRYVQEITYGTCMHQMIFLAGVSFTSMPQCQVIKIL